MVKEILAGLVAPVANLLRAREARKAAREAAQARLSVAAQQGQQKLELNRDEWEHLQVRGMGTTWKDEYITVSVVSIFNLIVIGGLLSAFGYPQVLEGVAVAMTALATAGVDVGFLLEAAVLAGLGLSVWKRF